MKSKKSDKLLPTQEKWNALRRGTGKGGRVCFIDVIEYSNGFVHGVENTTFWAFPGKSSSKDPDYHHNFDAGWMYM